MHFLSFSTYTFYSSVGRDNVRDLIRPSIYHWLGDWIGIRGEQIGCHGTNGALRWLPTASLAEISLFVESGKESYLNRKVGLVHSHLSLIIDDLASCSSKHPAYQFIILGARSFLSTLFFLCYSRNDVPKEIEVGPPLQLIKSAFFSVLRCTYSQVMRKNGFKWNLSLKK